VRGEFVYEINNLQRAIDEAYEGIRPTPCSLLLHQQSLTSFFFS
jgi:hypothetical protein